MPQKVINPLVIILTKIVMGDKKRQFYKRGWSHTKRRGHETTVNCDFCSRIVPKFRTFAVVRGFGINDPSLRKELAESGSSLSFLANKMYACPSCARHRGIVRKNRNRG